jgi:hypothetical protein
MRRREREVEAKRAGKFFAMKPNGPSGDVSKLTVFETRKADLNPVLSRVDLV